MQPIAEVRQRSARLAAEARELLDGGVLNALSEALGEVDIAGSVALDLMAWRDIDLFVRLEAGDGPRLLAVLPHLAQVLAGLGEPVARVIFRDEHVERDPAFPDTPGLYLGVTTAGRGWKIDLWGRPAYRSTDVYEFALAGAGDTLDDFERFQARRSG